MTDVKKSQQVAVADATRASIGPVGPAQRMEAKLMRPSQLPDVDRHGLHTDALFSVGDKQVRAEMPGGPKGFIPKVIRGGKIVGKFAPGAKVKISKSHQQMQAEIKAGADETNRIQQLINENKVEEARKAWKAYWTKGYVTTDEIMQTSRKQALSIGIEPATALDLKYVRENLQKVLKDNPMLESDVWFRENLSMNPTLKVVQ